MSERDTQKFERLFLERLPEIERILAITARRCGLKGEDGSDFAGWATMKLLENDYRILRRFRGRSRLSTYLVTVIRNLARDYQIRIWGRWRPSTAAKRLGALAIRVETLVYRDGLELHEAAKLLRAEGGFDGSEDDLARLLAECPVRLRRRMVGSSRLELLADCHDTSQRALEAESDSVVAGAADAVSDCLRALPREDRRLLELRFGEGMTVAAIARKLDLPQRALYTRVERALRTLRRQLEERGLSKHSLLPAIEQSSASCWEGRRVFRSA